MAGKLSGNFPGVSSQGDRIRVKRHNGNLFQLYTIHVPYDVKHVKLRAVTMYVNPVVINKLTSFIRVICKGINEVSLSGHINVVSLSRYNFPGV